jgi:hypothetical protein
MRASKIELVKRAIFCCSSGFKIAFHCSKIQK